MLKVRLVRPWNGLDDGKQLVDSIRNTSKDYDESIEQDTKEK